MKKNFLIVAVAMAMSSAVMAQSLTAYSRADVNQDNSVTVEDVTDAVNATLARANFQEGRVVDTYELNQTLQQIFTAIAELKNQINTVNNTVADMKYNVETAGKDFVDMGLPSGTLWAACNVGADKPEDPGKYFAWGETQGWYGNQIPSTYGFDVSHYKWYNGSNLIITRYTFDDMYYNEQGWEGTPNWYFYDTGYGGYKFRGDGYKTLFPEDDAAWDSGRGDWHMPTPEQFFELYSYCTLEYIDSPTQVIKLTSTVNGNSLIFPATGYCSGNGPSVGVVGGFYWTNSLSEWRSFEASSYQFWSNNEDVGMQQVDLGREYGCSVRPVCSK